MTAPTFATMAKRYDSWFQAMRIDSARRPAMVAVAEKITKNKHRYQEVCQNLNISEDWWTLVGCIHYREADCNFGTNLANGDSLQHKTVHVPAGGPPGNPPFKWEYAAEWALRREHMHTLGEFSIERFAYYAEGYNGWGYEERGVPSSYLWAGTTVHPKGKFVRDGVYSATTVDPQEGVMPLYSLLVANDATVTGDHEVTPKPQTEPAPATTSIFSRLRKWLNGLAHRG